MCSDLGMPVLSGRPNHLDEKSACRTYAVGPDDMESVRTGFNAITLSIDYIY